jgi:hypothetical protein
MGNYHNSQPLPQDLGRGGFQPTPHLFIWPVEENSMFGHVVWPVFEENSNLKTLTGCIRWKKCKGVGGGGGGLVAL